MAEETPIPKEKAPPPAPKQPKSLSTILMIVLTVLTALAILASIILGFIMSLPPEQPSQHETAQPEHKKEEKKEEKIEVGEIVPLEPFVVNLVDYGGRRFLKVSIELEIEDKKKTKELEKKLPYARNIIINILSSRTFDMVKTIEGKDSIRLEILTKLNDILTTIEVKNCYITEFTAQ